MSASSKKKLRKELNAAQMTEKQQNEQKEAKKLKIQTTIFVVAIVLVLVVALVSLAVTAFNNSGIKERNTTAATIGEHKLSAAELGYFYADTINQQYLNWYSNYGEYTYAIMMMSGLDLTKPLNEQVYDEDKGQTYADMFVDQALQNAASTYTMYDLAVTANQTLTEEDIAAIDLHMEQLTVQAKASNFGSIKDYLRAVYGNGATEKSYRQYRELLAVSNAYQQSVYDGLTYTEQDITTYNDAHFDEFSSFSYCAFAINVNDFLVCTADKDDTKHVHTDEEKAAAQKAAEKAANDILLGEPANANSLNLALSQFEQYNGETPKTCTEMTDVLYSQISNAKIVEWLADDSRTVGESAMIADTTETTNEKGETVTTTNGYTIIVFLGRNDNDTKLVNVRHILNQFEGGTPDENGNIVYTDAEKAAVKDALILLQDTWLSEGGTEEQFAQLATLKSHDTVSASEGGLCTNVYPGQMVSAFNDWCFDKSRTEGEFDIIETEIGYHLMYYVGQSDVTYRNFMIENTLRNNDYTEWYDGTLKDVKYTLHSTTGLKLDLVVMS